MIIKSYAYYRTTDMPLAAFLALYFPSYWIEDKEKGKATFVFDRGDKNQLFDNLIQAYWSGAPEAYVHPKKYSASLKDIKSRLYNE